MLSENIEIIHMEIKQRSLYEKIQQQQQNTLNGVSISQMQKSGTSIRRVSKTDYTTVENNRILLCLYRRDKSMSTFPFECIQVSFIFCSVILFMLPFKGFILLYVCLSWICVSSLCFVRRPISMRRCSSYSPLISYISLSLTSPAYGRHSRRYNTGL